MSTKQSDSLHKESQAYWCEKESINRSQMMSRSALKRKAVELMKKLENTVALYSQIGGDIFTMGGNASLNTSNFVWAEGDGSKLFVKDCADVGIPLFQHFTGRMAMSMVRKDNSRITKQLGEKLSEQEDQPALNLVPLCANDAEVVATTKAKTLLRIRSLLSKLPSEASVPVFTSTGKGTRNFWTKYMIENWPVQFPQPLAKPIATWSVELVDKILNAFSTEGHRWRIILVPSSKALGGISNNSSKNSNSELPSKGRKRSRKGSVDGDDSESSQEWLVERIIKDTLDKNVRKYFVKWLGWSTSHNSWVTEDDLNNEQGTCDALKQYNKKARI